MPKDLKFSTTVAQDGLRLDQLVLELLREKHPTLSRAAIKKLFTSERILLDGRSHDKSQIVLAGQHEVVIRNWSAAEFEIPAAQAFPAGCFLPIVYEDSDLLVLHKRSGIPSVPHSASETETAVGAALARAPLGDVGKRGLEPGLLHRLDTGTSGLLVFAKNDTEFHHLRNAWSEGRVRKWYRALTETRPSKASVTTIEHPLGHDAQDPKRMIAIKTERDLRRIRGKPLRAVTHVLASRELDRGFFELEIQIETGVMHQIRCHLASIGLPLVGDRIYRGPPGERLWLHAWKIILPRASGEQLILEAQMPEDWPQGR